MSVGLIAVGVVAADLAEEDLPSHAEKVLLGDDAGDGVHLPFEIAEGIVGVGPGSAAIIRDGNAKGGVHRDALGGIGLADTQEIERGAERGPVEEGAFVDVFIVLERQISACGAERGVAAVRRIAQDLVYEDGAGDVERGSCAAAGDGRVVAEGDGTGGADLELIDGVADFPGVAAGEGDAQGDAAGRDALEREFLTHFINRAATPAGAADLVGHGGLPLDHLIVVGEQLRRALPGAGAVFGAGHRLDEDAGVGDEGELAGIEKAAHRRMSGAGGGTGVHDVMHGVGVAAGVDGAERGGPVVVGIGGAGGGGDAGGLVLPQGKARTAGGFVAGVARIGRCGDEHVGGVIAATKEEADEGLVVGDVDGGDGVVEQAQVEERMEYAQAGSGSSSIAEEAAAVDEIGGGHGILDLRFKKADLAGE